jgi:hypothetical protein
MEVMTRRKMLLGVLTFFILAACSVTELFSRGGNGGDGAPTLILSPTPNVTLTAVFSPDTPDDDDMAEPTPTTESDAGTPTNTPEADETQPTETTPSIPYAETPAAAVVDGVQAFYVDDAPTIDGDLTDWAADMFALSHIVYGFEYYANEDDLSGRFKVAWDATYLYLGVVVFDTRVTQTASGDQLYLGDSLEILLDTDLAGDAEATELSSDDFQIGISPGNLKDIAIPEAYMWYPSDRASSLAGVQIGANLIERGYVVEVAVPWADVSVSPSDGLTLGFLLSVSDNDMLNMNAQQSVVSFLEGRELQNPTTWGTLSLVNP